MKKFLKSLILSLVIITAFSSSGVASAGSFRPLSQTKFINDANLVSYWKLDGNSNDSKGSNNGTDTAMSYGAGQFDSAGVFNGTSSYITGSTTGFPTGANAGTYSLWINMSSQPTSGQWYIFRYGNSSNGAMRVINYNYISPGVYSVGFDGYNADIRYTTTLTNGVWFHIVCVYTGTQSVMYINGNVVIPPTSKTFNTSTGTSYYISRSNTPDSYVNGLIDDIAIFSRALSSGEVAELYQSMTLGEYLPNSSTKLLLHLNGSSADSSGNNNNGTDTAITYSQANGKFGQGAGFNGTNSQIDVGNNSSLNISTLFTISAWFKLDNTSGRGFCLEKGAYNSGWDIAGESAGTFNLRSSGLSTIDNSTSSALFENGNWVYLTITYDSSGGSNNLKFYKNGNIFDQFTRTGGLTVTTTTLKIGRAVENVYHGKGAMDELLFENRAWSASEVKKYYTWSKGRFGL